MTRAVGRAAHAIDYARLAEAQRSRAERSLSLLRTSYLHGGALTSVGVLPSGVIVRQDGPHRRIGRGGVRGSITGFSPDSQRRLKRRLVALDFSRHHWQFITLTYPGEYSYQPRTWKNNLRALRAALERHWGDVFRGAIWRLEQQRRGAPHYHLLVCWAKPIPTRPIRRWVRETWTRVVGDTLTNATWVRTEVQDVRVTVDGGVPALMGYLCKYLGKTSHRGWLDPTTGELLPIGRCWGEWGEIPYASPTWYLLGPAELAQLVRRLRRLRPRSNYFATMTVDRFQGVFWGTAEWWTGSLRGLSWASHPLADTG